MSAADMIYLDSPLATYLGKLTMLRNNHEQLCLLAFEYRDSALSDSLTRCIQKQGSCPLWRAIRHYIGRLGSWWKACSMLASIAELDPKIFTNSRCKPIYEKMNLSRMLARRYPASFDDTHAVREQDNDGKWISNAHIHLVRRWGQNAASEYNDRYKSRQVKTYIHAELLVLNHFYRFNLKFADDVRYIGCSKPSCYCCHTYMRLHPWTVLSRPCHGNTWLRWAMPILHFDRNGTCSDRDAQLLSEMIHTMHCEIEASPVDGLEAQLLESTTGLGVEPDHHLRGSNACRRRSN